MERPRVCVIGAGVSGLSSALQVIERYPGVDLTVIAEKFSPHTTSDVAAGFWDPYLSDGNPPEMVIKWGKATYDYLNSVIMSEDAYEAGVESLTGYQFFRHSAPDPFWKEIPLEFRYATQREIDLYAPYAKHGWFFSSVICGCLKYLPWLEKKIKKSGGRLIKRRVGDLSELAGHYDIILNCTGLGSHHLVDDGDMTPVRGQVLRVKNTTARLFFVDNSTPENDESSMTYLFPWRDMVVLGGTARKGSWDVEYSEEAGQEIFDRCCTFVPSLKNATVLSEWAGLRPYRSKGVRLEKEVMKFGPHKVHVVHNYGHSGCGVTLHWGCAQDATELVGQCLGELPYSKL